MMNIPVLGVVQNMAYYECDNCGKRHYIYGKSDVLATAKAFGIKNSCEMPVMPEAAKECDEGNVNELVLPEIEEFFDKIYKYE